MKFIPIFILMAALLTGCATPIPVQVTHTATGDPVADVLVRRQGSANRWEKITNPVGTFYHPTTTAEAVWTDSEGRGIFNKIGRNDSYSIVTASSDPLTVILGTHTLSLDPGTNTDFAAWQYDAREIDGQWQINVTEPGWNCTRGQPN
ncbi:MAG: hypothetical protein JJU29_04290 [Verrucomicrobia bacterium]|nr:hypothetical protein [Verrucomicrobiota bacterium]MCH8512054.1 hypothetical protein [Kiritimatiellia bacterium]